MFDVRKLTVFREVAKRGSMSAAAAVVGYTTSAVSQQITSLERDLGHDLLIRAATGVTPTAEGLRLLEHIPAILDAVGAAEDAVARAGAAAPDVVRIASFASAAAAILPPALARFAAGFPATTVRLIPADPDEGIELLRAGDVEMCVITEVPGERSAYPDVVSVPICDDPFDVVLPRGHRCATLAAVPLSRLASEPWVVSSATGRCPDVRAFDKACRAAGFSADAVFHSQDYPTIAGLVAAGIGVSVIPRLAAQATRDDVVVRPVAGSAPMRRIALATNHTPDPRSVTAALSRAIVTAAHQPRRRVAADRAPRVSTHSQHPATLS